MDTHKVVAIPIAWSARTLIIYKLRTFTSDDHQLRFFYIISTTSTTNPLYMHVHATISSSIHII